MAVLDNLNQAYVNLSLLLVMTQQAMQQTPTQANVSAIVTAAQNAGVLTLKPTYSTEGESYDWTGYQSYLVDALGKVKRMIQDEAGPFMVVTRGLG